MNLRKEAEKLAAEVGPFKGLTLKEHTDNIEATLCKVRNETLHEILSVMIRGDSAYDYVRSALVAFASEDKKP